MEQYSGILRLVSARVFLRMEYGIIYKTFATFLYLTGQWTQIQISNIDVEGLYSATPTGGVLNFIQSESCFLLIKDSSFRDVNNHGAGGVVLISSPNSAVTIQNSIFHNVSSFRSGGAVYVLSKRNRYLQTLNRSQKLFVRLRIINSSFSNTTSRHIGGALYVITEKLFAIVRDSLFVRCSATSFPGTVYVSTYDDTTIRLHNNYFHENTGCNGGIVHATCLGKESFLNISITNVMFARNTLCKPVPAKNTTDGVVTILAASAKIVVDFENTHFIGNVGRHGCCILIYFPHASMLHSINLDTCTFRKNIGYFGTVFVKGQTH